MHSSTVHREQKWPTLLFFCFKIQREAVFNPALVQLHCACACVSRVCVCLDQPLVRDFESGGHKERCGLQWFSSIQTEKKKCRMYLLPNVVGTQNCMESVTNFNLITGSQSLCINRQKMSPSLKPLEYLPNKCYILCFFMPQLLFEGRVFFFAQSSGYCLRAVTRGCLPFEGSTPMHWGVSPKFMWFYLRKQKILATGLKSPYSGSCCYTPEHIQVHD